VLTIAAVVLALSALVGFHGGRAASSVTYDTNDLAYLLVSVMPLALAFVLNAKTRLNRIVNIGVLGVVVVALLLTSSRSRGGFLGLLAVLAVLVLLPIRRPQPGPQGGKRKQRLIPALLGIAFVAVVVWPNLPLETRTRLATVLSLKSDYNMDTENQHSRSSIWQRNFLAALERPIGYGVDSFAMVDVSTGGRFMAPHNAYLQVLVELGFLGLFLFLRVYVLAWRMLRTARQRLLSASPSDRNDEALILARMLQVGLVGNAVAGFFLSMAYSNVLWTLLGIVIGCTSLAVQGAGDAAQSQDQTRRS
jgi:O-antigen ligase